jgi:hypothetical protein
MYLYKGCFNTDIFNFAEKLSSIFGVSSLDSISSDIEILKRENDQNTHHHKLFYEWSRTSEFNSMYDLFIEKHIRPLYQDMIVIQKIPTFRICYPKNIAVGEFHKDKWYRNGDWAAKVKELNFFLPFTDAFDTNTIWVESSEDKNDFGPMVCKYGEFIQWDGPNLLHGNKINTTGKTRISIDFRVIEYKNYIPSDYGSINTKSKFKIGEYYKLYD